MARRCPTKRRFSDELDAKIALSDMQRKDKGAKRIYKCPFCNGFHITGQEKRGGPKA